MEKMKSTKDMTENYNSILNDSKIRHGCTMWLLERLSLNCPALSGPASGAGRAVEKHASEDRSDGPALINRDPLSAAGSHQLFLQNTAISFF